MAQKFDIVVNHYGLEEDEMYEAAEEIAIIMGLRLGGRKRDPSMTLWKAFDQYQKLKQISYARCLELMRRFGQDYERTAKKELDDSVARQTAKRAADSGRGKESARRDPKADGEYTTSGEGGSRAEEGDYFGCNVSYDTRRLACVQIVQEGRDASDQEPPPGVQGLAQVRLEQYVQETEASGLRGLLGQDGHGKGRWHDAGTGGTELAGTIWTPDGDCRSSFVSGGSDDVGSWGQDKATVPCTVAGLCNVWSGATEPAWGSARFDGNGSGLGAAIIDAGGESLANPRLDSGGSVAAQRVRFPSTATGAATFSENHAGSLFAARISAATDHADFAELNAAYDASGELDSFGKERCGTHSGRNANVRQSRRDQTLTSLRLSEGLRRELLSEVSRVSSSSNSQAEAGSRAEGAVSALVQRHKKVALHCAEVGSYDGGAGDSSICAMHEESSSGSTLPVLPTIIRKFSHKRRADAPDVTATGIQRRQASDRAGQEGCGQLLRDLDAEGGYLTSSTRAGARADPILAERPWVEDRSASLHGPAGSEGVVRNSKGSAAVRNRSKKRAVSSFNWRQLLIDSLSSGKLPLSRKFWVGSEGMSQRDKEMLAKANLKEACRVNFVATYIQHANYQRDIEQLYNPGPGPSTIGRQALELEQEAMACWEEIDSEPDDLDLEMDRFINKGQLHKGGQDVSDSDLDPDWEPTGYRVVYISRQHMLPSDGAASQAQKGDTSDGCVVDKAAESEIGLPRVTFDVARRAWARILCSPKRGGQESNSKILRQLGHRWKLSGKALGRMGIG